MLQYLTKIIVVNDQWQIFYAQKYNYRKETHYNPKNI